MDELTMLRELEDDVAPLSTSARHAARSRLRVEFEREDGSRPQRRFRRRLAIVVVATAFLGAAAAIVADSGDRRIPGWVQPASAAPVLQDAAREARGAAPLSYRDDQFLYTREIVEETGFDGPGSRRRFVNEYWRSADGSRPSKVIEHGRTWTEAPFDPGSVWPPRSRRALEALPTEPDELTAAVLGWFGGGDDATQQESAYMGLAMLIDRGHALPPGLRAAALEALAGIPGVVVTRDERWAGRPAVGITRPADGPGRESKLILLDRETYDYLGTRVTSRGRDGVEFVQRRFLDASGVTDAAGVRP